MKKFLNLSALVIIAAAGLAASSALAAGPSFDCTKVEAGSIEEMICKDPGLTALDVKLAAVYKEALAKATNEHPPVLKAEQRGWIKGRDDCWKSDDKEKCVEDEYTRRIAELQAKYRQVKSTGPVIYISDGNQAKEVDKTIIETAPPTMMAEYGDSTSLMFLEPSGSGSKYEGRNESAWIKGDDALVVWGFEAPEMSCTVRK